MHSGSVRKVLIGCNGRWKRRLLAAGAGLLALAAVGAVVLWGLVAFLAFDADSLFTGRVSTTVFDRHGRLLRAYLAPDDQWRIAVPLSDVSPWVIRATVAAEDRRFFRHRGVDVAALARATWQNLCGHRIVSGASTLTMQVVGLADTRERTLGRKLRQIVRALQLERCRTKEQILELYLTNAPYGGNICGVEAAAWRYFGKPARELAPAEAALLAGIPQSPTRLRPDRFPAAARRRAVHVLRRMKECGYLTEDDLRRALEHLPAIRTASPPVHAPHLCDFVHARYDAEPAIRTTLDLDWQELAEATLGARLAALADNGVTNGAVVVIDNATGEVRALVGSADYWNPAISGQVNGALAPRSPGSTLKPFIYALALERGLVLPTTTLADVPGLFSNYDPRNFDQQWHGLVPLDRALAGSLNVPAMQVLEQVGTAPVMDFLDAAGVQRVMPARGEVGLTLAVGTCSVRLLDVANACAMLARGGLWKPWRVATPPDTKEPELLQAARRWNRRVAREKGQAVAADITSSPAQLLSSDTCYFINKILSDEMLRDPADVVPELRGVTGFAWKTGTSNGYRDAWTMAWDGDFTVGVWMGNFDGKPSSALVGGRAAAPVALKLLAELRRRYAPRHQAAWPAPVELVETAICRESGELATALCPTTAPVLLSPRLARESPARQCQVHSRVLVDARTGALVCPKCMAGRPLRETVVAQWPTPVEAWLLMQGSQGLQRPPHCPDCPTISQARPPRIVAPHDGETFIVTSVRNPAFQQIRCAAVAESGVHVLYWFVDGLLAGTLSPAEALLWSPVPGEHELLCVDDRGKTASVRIQVLADTGIAATGAASP
jgi:penicillin-binding protein 1C